jgi:glycerate kinase
MKNILVAPTAFKGTLSPTEVAGAIKSGLALVHKDVQVAVCPVADGGDGTIDALHFSLGGTIHQAPVQGPLSQPVCAKWLELPGKNVIELASACGIQYIQDNLDPLNAHTFGLGQVLKSCLHDGKTPASVVVCLGGSASTDGGTGALRALGAHFFDRLGNSLPLGGGALTKLAKADLKPLKGWLNHKAISCAVDVTNPLLGREGAAHIFARQKGATPDEVAWLETALSNLADVMEKTSGKHCRDLPGAGAAGGTAFGLACGLEAKIISGFNWIADQLDLEHKIRQADLVISAEGKLDRQSIPGGGKVVGQISQLCHKYDKPLFLLGAQADDGLDAEHLGATEILIIGEPGQNVTTADIQSCVQNIIPAKLAEIR